MATMRAGSRSSGLNALAVNFDFKSVTFTPETNNAGPHFRMRTIFSIAGRRIMHGKV